MYTHSCVLWSKASAVKWKNSLNELHKIDEEREEKNQRSEVIYPK